MKRQSLFVALVGRAAGLSAAAHGKRFDGALTGGYDRLPSADLEITNGTTTLPGWDELFQKRDGCNNGVAQCSGYTCNHCGTCCGNNRCAENFGTCCDSQIYCAFGFACCTGSSGGCCYADTSFCCPTSPTGCCVKGTQCTANGCVGTPDFVVASKSVTTVYTQAIYNTQNVTSTFTSTLLGTTTNFVNSTVTSSNIDVATVTNYVTSTKVAKRTVTRPADETYTALFTRQKQPEPPSPTLWNRIGPSAVRDELGELGLLPKRAVTSYVIVYDFVWKTVSKDLFATSSVVTTVNSMETVMLTITSTIFKNAKSTTTVNSTVVVTMTQDTTTSVLDTPTDIMTDNGPSFYTPDATDTSGFSIFTSAENGGELTAISDNPNLLETGSTSTTSPALPTNYPTSDGNLSTGAKAGIGAGAGAVGLAVMGSLLFLWRRQRPRPRSFNTPDPSQLPVSMGSGSSWAPPRVLPPRHDSSMPERAAGLALVMASGRQAGSPQSYAEVGLALSSGSGCASPTTPSELGSSQVSPPSTASELMAGYQWPRDGTHEMDGGLENTGLGLVNERHEMPDQLRYELPPPPERTYKPYRPP